jgi:uncharacterized protein YlxP (DUF503 family)
MRVELRLPEAQSLKAKRSVLKRLKDQIRPRFNVSVAEVEPNELWQRACLGVVTVGSERAYVDGLLAEVLTWLKLAHGAVVIRVEHERW